MSKLNAELLGQCVDDILAYSQVRSEELGLVC